MGSFVVRRLEHLDVRAQVAEVNQKVSRFYGVEAGSTAPHPGHLTGVDRVNRQSGRLDLGARQLKRR